MDEDMKQIRFTIPGQPFGKQRPKFSRAGAYVKTYTPKETTSYENLVKLFYNEAAKGKMFPEGAMLDVRIIAYYEIPKSTSKKKRREMLEHRIRLLWSSIFVTLVAKKYHESVTLPSGLRMVYDNH